MIHSTRNPMQTKARPGKTAQWVKAFTTNSDNLSSSLRTGNREGETWLPKDVLQTSLHGTRSCHARFQMKKAAGSTQLWWLVAVSHDSDKCGKISLKGQQWHTYPGSNQQLSDWKTENWKPQQLPRAREVMDLGGKPTTTTLLKQQDPCCILNICPTTHRWV